MFSTALFLFLSSFTTLETNAGTLKVEIQQGTKAMPITNNEVILEKLPFSIVVTQKNFSDILVNISDDNTSFNQAKEGVAWRNIKGFKNPPLTEPDTICGKQLLALSTESNFCWTYTLPYLRGFQLMQKVGKHFTAARTVTAIMDLECEEDCSPVPVAEFSKPIYLVYITREGYPPNQYESARGYIKINWAN